MRNTVVGICLATMLMLTGGGSVDAESVMKEARLRLPKVIADEGATAAVIAPLAPVDVRIAPFRGDRVAAISFTFDDGWADNASIAAPLFDRHGLHATFFILPGVLSEEGDPTNRNKYARVSWKRWRQIALSGHEIGNHSFDHAPRFTDADNDKLRSEIIGAHDLIRDKIGIAPISFAMPAGNTLNTWSQKVIDSCHLVTRRSAGGYGGRSENLTVASANAFIDGIIDRKVWHKALFHAVENGYDQWSSASVLDGHLAYVAKQQDRLWVDTMGHIGLYVKEREAAKLETSAIEGGVKFTLTTPLDVSLYTEPLTVVIAAPGATIAQANREGREDSLPVSIRNQCILVDVIPGPAPVIVRWRVGGRQGRRNGTRLRRRASARQAEGVPLPEEQGCPHLMVLPLAGCALGRARGAHADVPAPLVSVMVPGLSRSGCAVDRFEM